MYGPNRVDATDAILRNIQVGGRRTSVRMERLHWDALDTLCGVENIRINEFCDLVDTYRGNLGLTAAMRLALLAYFVSLVRQADLLPHRPAGPARTVDGYGDGDAGNGDGLLRKDNLIDVQTNGGQRVSVSGELYRAVQTFMTDDS